MKPKFSTRTTIFAIVAVMTGLYAQPSFALTRQIHPSVGALTVSEDFGEAISNARNYARQIGIPVTLSKVSLDKSPLTATVGRPVFRVEYLVTSGSVTIGSIKGDVAEDYFGRWIVLSCYFEILASPPSP